MILKRCKIHVTEGSLESVEGEAYFSILNIDKHVDGEGAEAAMPGGLLKVI